MSKEAKIIIFFLITMALNIIAPIMCIKTYKSYTKESFIYGEPTELIIINDYVAPKDYVFQENISNMNFEEDINSCKYVFSYYFTAQDFDSTKSNYSIFINDYMCSITNLEQKSISGSYSINFNDINNNLLNSVDIQVSFEFYSSYSYLLFELDTTDITYFNGFLSNPGLILTLSKVEYAISGNSYELSTNLSINPTLTMSNYTYGQVPSVPILTGNTANATVSYYYNTIDSNLNGTLWDSSIVLDSGTYYMYAVIDSKDNYNGATTSTVQFNVNKIQVSSTVSVADYYVNSTPSVPTVSSNPDNAEVTYYCYSPTNRDYSGLMLFNSSSVLPVGEYMLFAIIGNTTNYKGLETEQVTFNVLPAPSCIVSWTGDCLVYASKQAFDDGIQSSSGFTSAIGNEIYIFVTPRSTVLSVIGGIKTTHASGSLGVTYKVKITDIEVTMTISDGQSISV